MAIIKMRRALNQDLQTIPLAVGEFGVATDTGNVYVGVTGGNHWVNPPTLEVETAERLKTPRQLTVSGDADAAGTFDGAADVSFVLRLANLEGLTPGTYTKLTVDGKGRVTEGTVLEVSDLPQIPADKVTGLGSAALLDTGVTAGKVVLVGEDGTIPESLMPALAVSDIFEAADEAAMLALNAQKGDLCIRTDEGKSYVLAQAPAATPANWKWLKTPDCKVLSVNGQTGAVTLTAGDLDAAPAAHMSAAADSSTLGHVKPGAGMHVDGDGALTVTGVDGQQNTNIQFKRAAAGADLPALSPGEPAILGDHLYVANAAGTAVKLATTAALEQQGADMAGHVANAEQHMADVDLHMADAQRHMADVDLHIAAAQRHMTDAELHMGDTERHITAAERSAWSDKGGITGETIEVQAIGDIQAGNPVHAFVGGLSYTDAVEDLSGKVYCSARSPDGTWIVLCGYFTGKAKLFSAADGQLTFVCDLPGLNGAASLAHTPYSAAFSPDSTRLAICGPNGGVYFYRIVDGTISFQAEIAGVSVYQEATMDIMFSPDGTMVAYCGFYKQQTTSIGFARIYTVTPEGYTLLKILEDELITPGSAIQVKKPVNSLAFSSDGRRLIITGSFHGAGNIYDVGAEITFRGKLNVPGTINHIRFRPNSNRVVLCGDFVGKAREYDIAESEALEVGILYADGNKTMLSSVCNSITFFQGGNLLALGGAFVGRVKLYAMNAGPATYLFDLAPKPGTTISAAVRAIEALPDDNTLFIGGDFSGYGFLCRTQHFARRAWDATVDPLYRSGIAPADIANGALGQVALFSGLQGNHAVSKEFLPISGGLVNGPLSIASPPTRKSHAATMGYVAETVKNTISTFVFRTTLEAAAWTGDTNPLYLVNMNTNNLAQLFIVIPNQMSEAEKLATAKADIKLYSLSGSTIKLTYHGVKPEIDLNIAIIGIPKLDGSDAIISL